MTLKHDNQYLVGDFPPSNLSKKDVEAYAEKVAEAGGFKPGGSLLELARSFGGKIHYQDFESWLSDDDGTIRVHGPCDFDIYIPQYTSPMRDRFTIAHELGHYFLHSGQGKKKIVATRSGSNERVEWEANWFAAAILMPETAFRRCFKSLGDIILVAEHFQVSLQAAQIRAKALNIG